MTLLRALQRFEALYVRESIHLAKETSKSESLTGIMCP